MFTIAQGMEQKLNMAKNKAFGEKIRKTWRIRCSTCWMLCRSRYFDDCLRVCRAWQWIFADRIRWRRQWTVYTFKLQDWVCRQKSRMANTSFPSFVYILKEKISNVCGGLLLSSGDDYASGVSIHTHLWNMTGYAIEPSGSSDLVLHLRADHS